MGQGRRALAALLSIAVAVVLAVAIDDGLGVAGAATKMGRALWAEDAGDQAKFALEGGSGSGDGDAAVSLSGEQTGIEAVPSWFEEELFALGGAKSVRVSGEGGVVGFSCAHSAESEFSQIEGELARKGWVESETGIEGCSVFVKEGGVCLWAMVSCVPVGEGASVVVQCVISED